MMDLRQRVIKLLEQIIASEDASWESAQDAWTMQEVVDVLAILKQSNTQGKNDQVIAL
jgi:hypothetical protein